MSTSSTARAVRASASPAASTCRSAVSHPTARFSRPLSLCHSGCSRAPTAMLSRYPDHRGAKPRDLVTWASSAGDLSPHDGVAAALLRSIHRAVCVTKDILRRHAALGDRGADAGLHDDVAGCVRHGPRDLLHEPFADLERFIRPGELLGDDDALAAPVPGNGGGLADRLARALRLLPKA